MRRIQLADEQISDDFKVVSAQAVGERALALFAIYMLSCTDTPRADVVHWIKSNNLWDSLSPKELNFVEAASPTEKQLINFSWHNERLHVLTWALDIIPKLASPIEQASVDGFQNASSPLNNDTAKRFLKTVKLRDEIELSEAANEIESHHWEARNANINNCQPKKPVNMEIIQERHHAINWILWGEVEDWDDVTTDT
ncbi:MAG: DUF4272 domain-containing protein [Acidimicrobiales bacterium]|nr:MAG: DUF4272 domain-containing protein [Acidimicrobiales bacterium]